jgi:hypothetical protein
MKQEIELLKALFAESDFEQQAARIIGEKIYRIEIAGLRHYMRENGRTYKSLTTFLDAVLPTPKALQSWRDNLAAEFGSAEKVDQYVSATADYGTALHIAIAEYCQRGFVEWIDFEHWALDTLQAYGMKGETLAAATRELIHDFAAIIQFFHDYRVEVIAVEIPVWSNHGIATLIDLVVEMDEKNYQKTPDDKRKRQKAIINLKSGKKGFFETHAFQLVGEMMMFNDVYSDAVGYKVEKVYNLAPTDWKEIPTYKLKDQTENILENKMKEQFNVLLEFARLRGILDTPKRKFQVFTGITRFGESPANNIETLDYKGMSTKKINEYHDN